MDFITTFDGNVRKDPSRDCLRDKGQSLSYGLVQRRSFQAARTLAAQGVQRGDRVALMCFNTPGFIYAMLGAWRLGAAIVPVNHKLQAPEVAYILEHSSAKLLIADGALAPVLAGKAWLSTDSLGDGAHGDFDALLAAAEDTPWPEDMAADMPADENAVAELLYTSGTTGKPKACVMTQRKVVQTAIGAVLALGITRDERTLLAMPIWHSSPLNNWLLGTLFMAGTVVLLREYHPAHFLNAVQAERITLFFGAPVAYSVPLQMVPHFADYDLSSVRAWIYGGGPIGAEQARKLIAAYQTENFYQVYGMTETGPAGTVLYPSEQVTKAGSIGRYAMPGVDMRVVDANGHDVQRGEIGEIWLRGESTMQGYLNDPEATAKAFAPGGWYRSGDLARVDADGYLFIVDRSKDMIITGGENVYSKEVEDVLCAHPQLADVAVIGKPHPDWGETVIAHYVPKAGATVTDQQLKDYCADKLAKFKIPREFVQTTTLPRTPTGKLQKFMLRTA